MFQLHNIAFDDIVMQLHCVMSGIYMFDYEKQQHHLNVTKTWLENSSFIGLDVTKPVFGVSDKVIHKPVSSATETS